MKVTNIHLYDLGFSADIVVDEEFKHIGFSEDML